MPILTLSMIQNKTGLFFLSVYEADGVTPQDLTGTTLWFHASYPPQGFTVNKNSPASGITIQTITGGLNCATLQIDPADTTSLAIGLSGSIQMNCELTLQSGASEFELSRGTLTMMANVGTP